MESFSSTSDNIGEVSAIVLGASFRAVSGTVFKVNYRRQGAHDLLNNAATKLGALQVGFASYF